VIYLTKHRIFFSTTYAADILSLAAAQATILEFKEKPVVKTIWENGTLLMEKFNKITSENSINLHLEGYPVRMKVIGQDSNGNDSILLRSLFIQEFVKRGIFVHPGVEYISYSHSKDDIDKTIQTLNDSVPTFKKAIEGNNIESFLEGKPIRPVYSIVKPSIHKP